jgi:RimJ/RimL family protein N-acetyltransferase
VTVEPVRLATERLELTIPEAGDVDAITEFCRDPLFERVLTTPWPYARAHAVEFVTRKAPEGWADGSELTWALRREGALIGTLGTRSVTGSIGFWLGAPFRRQGYMREALDAVCHWLLESRSWPVLRWEAVPGNIASAAVARSVGFRFTGTGALTVPVRGQSSGWHAELREGDLGTVDPGWPELLPLVE